MTDLTDSERAKVDAAAETCADNWWGKPAPKGGEDEMRKQKAIEHAEKYWGPREELEDEEQNNFDAERDAHLAGWDAARAHPPATEARIEKGLIDGVEVDFLIENPPATDARVGRLVRLVKFEALPALEATSEAVSLCDDLRTALRELESNNGIV